MTRVSLHLGMSRFLAAGMGAIALVIIVSPALATPLAPHMIVSDGGTQLIINSSQFTKMEDGSFHATSGSDWIGSDGNVVDDPENPGVPWAVQYDITGDPDPYVDGTFAVLNFSGSTQTFSFSYLQPVFPHTPVSTNGSIEISVQDFFNSGAATLANSGATPIYQSLIDGAAHVSMLSATTLSVSTTGGIASTSDTFSTGPTGAVTSDIGIDVVFTLTNFDLAAGTVFFETIIPEPSSLSLIAIGLVGLAGWRVVRRRRVD